MTYQILMRPVKGGYDVWVPDLPGCVATGATEAEALVNIKQAIADRHENVCRTSHEGPEVTQHSVVVEIPGRKEHIVEVEAQVPAGPMPLGGWTQLIAGAIISVLGLVGVGFFFSAEATPPFFLFAPILVMAAGVPGIVFGAMTLADRNRQAAAAGK